MTPSNQLTVEQQLSVRMMKERAKGLSEDEVKENLILMYTQIVYQDIRYREELGKKWGITK